MSINQNTGISVVVHNLTKILDMFSNWMDYGQISFHEKSGFLHMQRQRCRSAVQ